MPEDVFRLIVSIGVVLTCIAFVVQAVVVIALYRVSRKTQSRVLPLVERAEPIMETARKVLDEAQPRISELSAEVVGITKTAREQVNRLNELLNETTDRAKVRIAQIDKGVDETVVQVEQVGDALKSAVMKPVKEVNGLVAGMKAAIATYAAGGRREAMEHITQDEEMFI